MALSLQQKNKFIEGNRREFGNRYEQLYFPGEKALSEFDKRRRYLLQKLAGLIAVGCAGTKLDMAGLSPGCRVCIEGQWSCLFINGKCNGNCFYCPTSQDEIGLPTTNTLSFHDPKEYAAYLQVFDFQGASISGGEPLLTLDKSIRFIRSTKNRLGENIHVWLYTNGILATREIMEKLADAGLDEIRFDIGATGYKFKQLEHAAGIIPTVTVEIPAIPEESERIKNMLPSLYNSGVQHLNLHQLRLTPYNFEKLVARGYKFLHGKKVTVLNSELTALEILLHGKKKNIPLPINYCSFPYKDQFQALAARRRNGPFIMKSYESLTENGFIRSLTLTGNDEILSQHLLTLKKQGYNEELWKLNGSEELYVHLDLLPHIDLKSVGLRVSYSSAYQRPSPGYRNPFTKVAIYKRMNIVIERETSPQCFSLTKEQAQSFLLAISSNGDMQVPLNFDKNGVPEEIFDFEFIRPGLIEYY